MWEDKKKARRGRRIDYGSGNTGNIGNGDNHNRWIPGKKNVFLEPDMEPKKQRNFYILSFLLIPFLGIVNGLLLPILFAPPYLLWMVGISSISAFIMSITIIVLIMQGNKRSFYHEQVSNMQSGLIKFMAEIVEAFFAADIGGIGVLYD